MAPNLPAKPRAGRMITVLGAATGLSTAMCPQALSIILVMAGAGAFLLISVFAAALFGGTRLSSRAFRLIRLCKGSSAKLLRLESRCLGMASSLGGAGRVPGSLGQLARARILTRLWVNTRARTRSPLPSSCPGGCGPSRSGA
jgi:hypothetical protein